MSCLATTAQWVEMQTPLFSGKAWAFFHEHVLSIIPEEGLATSDFGLDIIWCALLKDAFPMQPACLVMPSAAATHLNSHAIEAYMNKDVIKKERSCTTTCRTIQTKFHSYWKNFSHHTGECFSVARHQGLRASGQHYAVDGDGVVRARSERERFRGRGDPGRKETSTDTASQEDAEQASAEALLLAARGMPRILGATMISSRVTKERSFSVFTSMLSKLCQSMPGLQFVLNVHDGNQTSGMSSSHHEELSVDSRISTTWIQGARALFWKRVLTPYFLRSAQYVWVFDYTVLVHPSVNPLAQLVHVLTATDGMLVSARMHDASGTVNASADETGCDASTVHVASLSPSTVIRTSAWELFHFRVLKPLSNTQLTLLDKGIESVMCSSFAESARVKPRCLQSQTIWVHQDVSRSRSLADGIGPNMHARRCPPQSPCSRLVRTLSATYNTSSQDPVRCWVAGPRGLTVKGATVRERRGGRG